MYEPHWSENEPQRDELDRSEGRTVVEFGAEWCPHCQAVQPLLKEKLAAAQVRHVKVADGKGRPLGRSYKVKLWPNFVLLENGEAVRQLARPPAEELARELDSFLS